MPKIRTVATVASLVVAAAAATADAQVVQAFNLSSGMGVQSVNSSPITLPVSPAYQWSMNMTSLSSMIQITGFPVPVSQPLVGFGVNPVDMVAAGTYIGGPGTMFSRTFSSPGAYSFTVSLEMLANQTVQSKLNVTFLGAFPAGTFGPTNMFPTPVTSISAAGTSNVVAVPTPGAAALLGAGGLLAIRRRRQASV